MWTWNLQQNLPDGSSYLNFRDWKDQSRQFEQMAAYLRPEFTRGTLTADRRFGAGQRRPRWPGLLRASGCIARRRPRTLVTEDFRDRATAVVISHALWQQRFAGAPQTIGRTIRAGWSQRGSGRRHASRVRVADRRRSALAPALVRAELAAGKQPARRRADRARPSRSPRQRSSPRVPRWTRLPRVSARNTPTSNASFGVTTDPLVERVIGSTTERSLWLLFGSVGFVLLIACANVANLMLARVTVRSREFSLRTALGASRIRLIRQALTENLVVSLLAGTVGALIAWLGVLALRAWAAGVLPRANTIRSRCRVLLFAMAASLGCGLVAGLLPALQLSIGTTAYALRDAGPRLAGRTRRAATAPGAGRRGDRPRGDPARPDRVC